MVAGARQYRNESKAEGAVEITLSWLKGFLCAALQIRVRQSSSFEKLCGFPERGQIEKLMS